MTRYFLGVAFIMLTLLSPSSAMANWLINGDFETGATEPWIEPWNSTGTAENLAVATQSIISGTASVEVLNQNGGNVPGQAISGTDFNPNWVFDMDFACFSAVNGMAMNCAVMYDYSGGGQFGRRFVRLSPFH